MLVGNWVSVGERRGKKIRLRKKKNRFYSKGLKKKTIIYVKQVKKKLPLDSPWHRSSI
jgi:hypothetical protein